MRLHAALSSTCSEDERTIEIKLRHSCMQRGVTFRFSLPPVRECGLLACKVRAEPKDSLLAVDCAERRDRIEPRRRLNFLT